MREEIGNFFMQDACTWRGGSWNVVEGIEQVGTCRFDSDSLNRGTKKHDNSNRNNPNSIDRSSGNVTLKKLEQIDFVLSDQLSYGRWTVTLVSLILVSLLLLGRRQVEKFFRCQSRPG